MSSRRDFYYRQTVTEAELDAGFAGLEASDRYLAADALPVGVVTGAVITQHAPLGLTVDASGTAVAYDQAGQRIAFGPAQNINVALDYLSVSTEVAVPGNEKWVSVFLQFDRALSDPRLDGNGDTVYFVREESFKFIVVQGAEALIGAALRPALKTDAILLADVHRVQGQTQIVNADINTTRREDAVTKTGATWSLSRGTLRAAVYDLLDAMNAHVAGTGNHDAADVVWVGGGSAWRDAETNPQTDVTTQLAKIITDLTSQTASHSGAHRIGTAESTQWKDGASIAAATIMDAINDIIARLADSSGVGTANGAGKVGCKARTAWLGSRANAAGSVYEAIDKIITDLAVQDANDDGAERIGAQASAGGPTPYAFSAGSVRSQLDYLLTHLNSHAALGDTDKHIVAEGAYTYDGTGLIESFGAGTPNFADAGTLVYTLAGTKTNDVIWINAHVGTINTTGTGGASVRLAVEVNGTTHELQSTERSLPDAVATNSYSVSARYVMPSDHDCKVKFQAMHIGAGDPGFYGGAVLRAMAIR